MIKSAIIRAFDGSRADAEGLLAVERATFDESPYGAGEVQAMLTNGPQRAWLALVEGKAVGFVVAFATHGLRGPSWEIDLLAVRAEWTRQGLATRLVRAAAAHGTRVARQTRAAVATDNTASVRAFVRAGFQPADTCELWIFRTEGQEARSASAAGVTVREAADVAEAADWLPEPPPPGDSLDLTLLLAEWEGKPMGYVELVGVETLLYRGLWIESLAASTRAARTALVREAVNRAIAAGLDEIGALVPAPDRLLLEALRAAGFRSLGEFHLLTARLPLPGLASSLNAEATEGGQPEAGHV